MIAEAPSSPDPSAALRPHRDHLLVCGVIVLLALVLRLNPAGQIVLPFLDAYPLPASCPTRVLFRLDCPGCGLTRSFIALAHGDVVGAFGYHRMGPFLFLLVLVQLPIRGYVLLRRMPAQQLLPRRTGAVLGWLIVGGLLLNWGYNLVTGAAFH